MWPAYKGGKILVVKVGLRQLPGRLGELLASGSGHNQRAPVPK